MHNFMSGFERKKIEMELKAFTSRNFEKPGDCRNLDQIRFYVSELAQKIEEMEKRFSYVPEWAYALLAQYNSAQNRFINADFQKSYCQI
jgi:hypothetical protein